MSKKIPGMSHVGIRVNGGTACVPLDGVGLQGDEGFLGDRGKVRVGW